MSWMFPYLSKRSFLDCVCFNLKNILYVAKISQNTMTDPHIKNFNIILLAIKWIKPWIISLVMKCEVINMTRTWDNLSPRQEPPKHQGGGGGVRSVHWATRTHVMFISSLSIIPLLTQLKTILDLTGNMCPPGEVFPYRFPLAPHSALIKIT